MTDHLTTEADWDAAEHTAVTCEMEEERASELRAFTCRWCGDTFPSPADVVSHHIATRFACDR